MKAYLYLLPLLLLSCKNEPAKPVGQWDFNGDGKDDNDIIINRNDGKGHIESTQKPDTWTIAFSNKTLPNITITGGEPTPMGEGDVTGDGAAELIILQDMVNGGKSIPSIWTFTGGEWKQLEEYHPQPAKNKHTFRAGTLRRPYR